MTTMHRCSGGMPWAKARRGRRLGRDDSLIRRLMTATAVSEAGNSISSAASDRQPRPGLAMRWQVGVVQQHPGDDAERRRADRGEVGRQCGMPPQHPAPVQILIGQTEGARQRRLARAAQPVAGHARRLVVADERSIVDDGRRRRIETAHHDHRGDPVDLHEAEQGFGDLALARTALLGQQLDGVQGLVAGVVALGGEGRRAEHEADQDARVGDDVGPVPRRRSNAAS